MKKSFLFLLLIFWGAIYGEAQNPQWVTYTENAIVNSIAEQDNDIWAGTTVGLLKINKSTGELILYNVSNSDLPYIYITSLAIDGFGNKWIGTAKGLAKFDGTNWTIFNLSNSGLPDDWIYALAVDATGNIWIGTNYGLTRYNGTNWETFTSNNSGLSDNAVRSIVIEGNGIKWVGTNSGGLVKFDGTYWTTYDYTNSELPDYGVTAITIDANGS